MRNLNFFCRFTLLLFVPLVFSCKTHTGDELSISFEKYTLDNGLEVILHQDHSDPVVAVAIQYHVGSNRETPGRTGFAHLFEHMMFQRSENVGEDEFFKKIQEAGGTLNGGTSNDGTVYFEVVPRNALELALWLESDRMGYMINTVTRKSFANQQNVVQNEKRQMVDNRPYGHTSYVISKNLYPEGHPYSWQVIGEMEDLFHATVDDVKEFHSRFYVPNNATMAVAGDFDAAELKSLIEKYFGEIPKGKKVPDPEPWPVSLQETKKLFHEDNFARIPQLRMVWPTVEQYHPDAYALRYLAELLSQGKKAPMYKVLVKEKNLTSRTAAYSSNQEIAGTFNISISANQGVGLSDIEQAVFEAFTLFEEERITETDLERIKAGLETSFYNSIGSVLGKAFQLARYNEYAGDPGFITEDIALIKAVSIDDIMRVYEKYIKDKPCVVTSFVPRGQTNLIAEGSVRAEVKEENIAEATQVIIDVDEEEELIERTPTQLDRSVEPVPGPDPTLTLPSVWEAVLENGMKAYGIFHDELPLVQYSIVIESGVMADKIEKAGVARLVSQLMMEGTASKTPEELEEAIELLGANIGMFTGTEQITIRVNTLERNFEKTLELVREMLLEPRWDGEEFALAKTRVINDIERMKANPDFLGDLAFNKLIHGKDHILAYPAMGTIETVNNIEIDDLKDFYRKYFYPCMASFHIVGMVEKERTLAALESLISQWQLPGRVELPAYHLTEAPEKSKIYFVDIPDAKQSVIYIGAPSIPRTHPDFFPATVMNHKLGGSFNSVFNMILREEKGFTYGARSSFTGMKNFGKFVASTSVRSDATLESMTIFRDEMKKYREGISQEDLDFTRNALVKSNALRFETLGALLGMIQTMSHYNLSSDYIKMEEKEILEMSPDRHRELARSYVDPGKMIWVVAGDRATQMEALKELGFGEPVLYRF